VGVLKPFAYQLERVSVLCDEGQRLLFHLDVLVDVPQLRREKECSSKEKLNIIITKECVYDSRQKSGRALQSTFCFDLVKISQNWKQLQHEARGFSSCSS
jgi:hypothetical protein